MQGVEEAKKYMENIQNEATAEAASSSGSAANTLSKFFRVASRNTIAKGLARVTMEEAVKNTERILLEKKRLEMAKTASDDEKAEVLAQELYNEPGSLLQEKELAHIYTESGCPGAEVREEVDCNSIPNSRTRRTITGVCNNLEHPTQGASETPFQRMIPARYADGISAPFNQAGTRRKFLSPHPSARLVSSRTIRDVSRNDRRLTHLTMQWGQFMDHDLDLAVEAPPSEVTCNGCAQDGLCFAVVIPPNDFNFGRRTKAGRSLGKCLPFRRTLAACPENPTAFNIREQVNELTHYIDGSMVYGSTDEVASTLRGSNGRLRVSANNNLPIHNSSQVPCALPNGPCCQPQFGARGCFLAGDVRALEHVSLTVMHTIWVREHNRIVKRLRQLNPGWSSDRLFLEARDIVIAQIQQITFNEYLPALYGSRANMRRFIQDYNGYNPEIDASIPNVFATAAFRFGHSQIQPNFARLNRKFRPIRAGPLSLLNSFFSTTEFANSADGGPGTEVDTIARGWIVQPARAVDEFLNSILTTQLFQRGKEPGMDLATLNIQRGRDHGLPGYATWKRFCLNAFRVSSPFQSSRTRAQLRRLYFSNENIDLFVGAMSERTRRGSSLGSILSCIFGLTFSRLRDGDRFWYENKNTVFSPAQLRQIRRTSFARVLCDNTNVNAVQKNPFLRSRRRSCRTTPGINLSAWREKKHAEEEEQKATTAELENELAKILGDVQEENDEIPNDDLTEELDINEVDSEVSVG